MLTAGKSTIALDMWQVAGAIPPVATAGRPEPYWRLVLLALGFVLATPFQDARAQSQQRVHNVVLITLDGLRTEEVFRGADRRLMTEENGVKDSTRLLEEFWRESEMQRRELLLPFLWSQCQSGQAWIGGDLTQDSQVKVTNGRYFSYPGYNEILTGAPDELIDSNAKKYNENVSVLEWLHAEEGFRGKIAAYCSWDVFPFILNDRRSGIRVNAGWQPLSVGNPDRLAALNLVGDKLFHEWDSVRYDVLTASGAIEELKTTQPRLLFVSLGETDDWAHAGRYDRYLLAAQQNDYFIRQLWETTQSIAAYRDSTLFLITTDHGRGDGREAWKSHGAELPGSQWIWIAAMGPGLRVRSVDQGGRFQQAQIAATVAQALGYDFTKFRMEIQPPLPILVDASLR